ncbi:hypothetical protein SLA2020_017200 [Shorea laevis]
MNGEWHRCVTIQCHLLEKGFMNGYVVWLEEPGNDPIREMVLDAMSSHGIEYNRNEQANDEPIFEEAMGDVKEFFDLLQVTNTPLYDGCDEGDTVLK